jgi:hypothetical protein
MEVRGNIRRGDLFIGTILHHLRRKFLWCLSAITGGMITFLAWSQGTVRVGPVSTAITAVIIFLPATIVVQLLTVAVSASYLALRPQPVRGFLGPRLFRVDDSGLLVESTISSTRLVRSGIVSVIGGRFGVLIELPGASAFFVPRRFFADREQLDRFAEAVSRGRDEGATGSFGGAP